MDRFLADTFGPLRETWRRRRLLVWLAIALAVIPYALHGSLHSGAVDWVYSLLGFWTVYAGAFLIGAMLGFEVEAFIHSRRSGGDTNP